MTRRWAGLAEGHREQLVRERIREQGHRVVDLAGSPPPPPRVVRLDEPMATAPPPPPPAPRMQRDLHGAGRPRTDLFATLRDLADREVDFTIHRR